MQPGTFTQATPPNPRVVGALVSPEIVAGNTLPTPCAKVTGAIVTLTGLAVPVTVTVWETDGAAEYVGLPDCEAVIVQLPAAMNDTVEPETVQMLAGVLM